jgi:hypothetical protein
MITEVLEDLRNIEMPRDPDTAFAKLKCDIEHGQRVGWYYTEDDEYAKEWLEDGEDIRISPPYQGMMIATNGTELRGGHCSEIDEDRCIVIMDTYPVEKCYPEAVWIALNRLLDNDDLVEVIALVGK